MYKTDKFVLMYSCKKMYKNITSFLPAIFSLDLYLNIYIDGGDIVIIVNVVIINIVNIN